MPNGILPRRLLVSMAEARERQEQILHDHFPLSEALLCAQEGCDTVFRSRMTCPRCGSSGEFFVVQSRFETLREEITAAKLGVRP
jgi:hypothetical protein